VGSRKLATEGKVALQSSLTCTSSSIVEKDVGCMVKMGEGQRWLGFAVKCAGIELLVWALTMSIAPHRIEIISYLVGVNPDYVIRAASVLSTRSVKKGVEDDKSPPGTLLFHALLLSWM
jgi:hypothetical protein